MFDYEHFLRTQQQREYIHSLPNTLKNPDIKVEKNSLMGLLWNT